MSRAGFLGEPSHSAEAQGMFDDDVAEVGHVMNTSRLWAYEPATAAAVLRGTDDRLAAGERALAGRARKVARDPNGTRGADVQQLRDAGFAA